MAISPVGAATAAAPAVDTPSAGFDSALNKAIGNDGAAEQQFVDQLAQGGVQQMGQLMMRHAGDMLNEAMEDDEG